MRHIGHGLRRLLTVMVGGAVILAFTFSLRAPLRFELGERRIA